jgi:hypothetical protein
MKQYKSSELLEQLQSDIRELLVITHRLKLEDPGMLLEQPAPGKWNVVQVLEHLQQNKPSVETFKPGWIGDYFTKMMRPTPEGKVKYKMKAPKDHRPNPHLDHVPVIQTFIDQQQTLLNLLEKAKSKNIGSIRTPISISRFIKLKAGDTFRFLVAHEQRHFLQISRTLQHVKKPAMFSMAL